MSHNRLGYSLANEMEFIENLGRFGTGCTRRECLKGYIASLSHRMSGFDAAEIATLRARAVDLMMREPLK